MASDDILKGKKILVVDDDKVTLHLVGRAFSPEDAVLEFAENGEAALEKAEIWLPMPPH